MLDGVCAALVWSIASRLLSRRLAVLTTVFWVALPNRSTTRFWPATGGNVLALLLVLVAARVAVAAEVNLRRYVVIVVLASVSALAYEGGIALGALVCLYAIFRSEAGQRLVRLAIAAVGLGATAVWMATHTEKTGRLLPGSGKEIFLSAHFGRGVFPPALLFLGLLVVAGAAWSLAAILLPSFRAGEEERLAVAGLVVLLAGAAPFLITGLAHGTSGLFDRGNLYADAGTAMVYAGVTGLLWRPRVAWSALAGAAVLLVGILAFQNVQDLEDFQRAGDDGRRLLAAVDALSPAQRHHLVVAPLPDRNGVSMFVADYDLQAALALRYHEPRSLQHAAMAQTVAGARRVGGMALRGRRLVPLR